MKEYRSKNREMLLQQMRDYRIRNAEALKIKEAQRRSTHEFREYNRKQTSKWASRNRARLCLKRKERYILNRDKILAARSTPAEKLKSHIRSKRYRETNKAKVLASLLRWRKTHPEAYRRYARIRRAIQSCATVGSRSAIKELEKRLRSLASVRCYWCQRSLPGSKMHLDHIIPLNGRSKGDHSVENLCAACPQCNCSKKNTHPNEWMNNRQPILL